MPRSFVFPLTVAALIGAACCWPPGGLAEEPVKQSDKTDAKAAATGDAGQAARVPDATEKPVVTVH